MTATTAWEQKLKQAQEVDADKIFIYKGGRAPRDVTHVIIDKSITIISFRAFQCCEDLRDVKMHDGIEAIGRQAFAKCNALTEIDVTNVKVIGEMAFSCCSNLRILSNSEQVKKIGDQAFLDCCSLIGVNLPSVRVIGGAGFSCCTNMMYANLGKYVEVIERSAFYYCISMERVRFELGDKRLSIGENVFDSCRQLTSVEVVGNIHESISSLGSAQWQDDMNQEIDRINGVLPDLVYTNKTVEVSEWIDIVQSKIECYKHMENTSLLELALWKATKPELGEDGGEWKKEKCRINCGAAVVIPNVLAFIKAIDL